MKKQLIVSSNTATYDELVQELLNQEECYEISKMHQLIFDRGLIEILSNEYKNASELAKKESLSNSYEMGYFNGVANIIEKLGIIEKIMDKIK